MTMSYYYHFDEVGLSGITVSRGRKEGSPTAEARGTKVGWDGCHGWIGEDRNVG